MTTKEAWKKVINQKGIEEVLGIKPSTLYWFRSKAEGGIYPTETAMEMHLKKAGKNIVREREWN